VRFHPSGKFFMSVGSDKKIFVYDGLTGEFVREIKCKHKGSIYAFDFNDDGSQFVTVSADKTAKIWDFEKGECIQTVKFADKPAITDMQVACGWAKDYIVSVSLSGQINFLSPDKDVPVKVLAGHKKAINSMDVDEKENKAYTACKDGYIVETDYKTGANAFFTGKGHGGTSIKYVGLNCDRSKLLSISTDGLCLLNSVADKMFAEKGVKVDGAPRCFATANLDASLALVGTHKNQFIVLRNGEVEETVKLEGTPCAIAFAPDDSEVAVALEDLTIVFFNLKWEKSETLKNELIRGKVSKIKYSPCGKRFLTADDQRNIWNWDRGNLKDPVNSKTSWRYHDSTVSDLAWSSDSKQVISVGMDGTTYLWKSAFDGANANVKRPFCHPGGITNVAFCNDDDIVTTGYDGAIKIWKIAAKVEEKSNIF